MRFDEKGLAKAHKEGRLPGVLLLYGGESYLVELWTKRLVGGEGGFDAQRLDGKKPDLNALWDALQAMPLFASEKTVLLDGLEAGSLDAEGIKSLGELLAEAPDGVFLVMASRDPGFGGSPGGKKLVKLAEKHGGAAELSTPAQGDLAEFLMRTADERGCRLSAGLARYLIQLCPSGMHILENELLKACAYAGGGEITRKHIDAVASPKIEARAFDLQKHILAGDCGAALRLLADLFQLREEPVAILGALSMGFCDLYRARCVRECGGSRESLAVEFGYKSEYRARRAFEESGKRSLTQLRRAVAALCECDRLLKSTGADGRVRLERLVVSLTGICGEGR